MTPPYGWNYVTRMPVRKHIKFNCIYYMYLNILVTLCLLLLSQGMLNAQMLSPYLKVYMYMICIYMCTAGSVYSDKFKG